MRSLWNWSLFPVAALAVACGRADLALHDDLQRDLQLASAQLNGRVGASHPLTETLPPVAALPPRQAPSAAGTSSAQRSQPAATAAPVSVPDPLPTELPAPASTPAHTGVVESTLPAIPRPVPPPIPAAEPANGGQGGGVSRGPTVVIGGGTVVIRGGAVGIDDCAAHDARRGGVYRAPPGGIAINSRFPPPVPRLPRPQP